MTTHEPMTLGTRGVPVARGRLLEWLLLALAFAPLLFLQLPSDLPWSNRISGAMLWLLCVAPSAVYVSRRPDRREPIPFFPMIAIVYGVYYALPVIMGAVNLAFNPNQIRIAWLDPKHDFSAPIAAVLYGWLAALAGYMLLAILSPMRHRREDSWRIAPILPWLIRIALAGMIGELVLLVITVPGALRGALNFAGTVSRFAIALLLVLRLRGRLSHGQSLLLLAIVPTKIILILATGSIANVLLFVLLLVLANWLGGGRIRTGWLVGGLLATLTLVTLKGVLVDYRRQAWFGEVELSVPERTALMYSLISDQVAAKGPVGAVSAGWEAATSRSATLDLLADVVRRTPRDIPYWGGSTYLSLVGFAIPRVLWPNKPQKTLGQDFGHRYTYLDNRDRWTSVNFPFLVEFYANFGVTGVIVGMFITGMLYRMLDMLLNRPGQSVVMSLASMSILIPLLNIESDFSLVFGGVFLNAVAFGVVLRFLRAQAARTSGQARAPAHAQLPRRSV